MKTIIITIFIFCSGILYSQQGSISGRVTDEKGNSPIADATVQITKAGDSTIISGTGTDADGRFKLSKIPFGKYDLRVKYISYNTLNIANIVIS